VGVQRTCYMNLETIVILSDETTVSLPAMVV
jgi:hypothetical protein